MLISKLKPLLAAFGDIAILYGALILTLLIRYGTADYAESFSVHLEPFSIIFIVWLLVFYLSDLYSNKFFKFNLAAAQVFFIAIIINLVLSIVAFYAFESFFQLTPKTNLLIFGIIFGIFDCLWRLFLSRLFISGGWRKQILIIGNSPSIAAVAEYLKNNPQTGYHLNFWLKENLKEEKFSELVNSIIKNKIDLVIADTHIKKDSASAKLIYKLLPLEIQIMDFADFYESIFQKVPLEELEESWFIESIATSRRFYDAFKRTIDAILAVILIIIFLPIIFLSALLIKTTSIGPAIYKQKRIGKNNKPFILYKFRTMKNSQKGPLWTDKNDERLTPIGRILRYTHLDELPQLYNILKGDISFIGPRPERSELVELYQKLPFYEIRHIIKPGLTGWAQVNYRPSASIKEAYEKLQYDIYYIKNRSLILDFLILLKTIRYLFISNK